MRGLGPAKQAILHRNRHDAGGLHEVSGIGDLKYDASKGSAGSDLWLRGLFRVSGAVQLAHPFVSLVYSYSSNRQTSSPGLNSSSLCTWVLISVMIFGEN